MIHKFCSVHTCTDRVLSSYHENLKESFQIECCKPKLSPWPISIKLKITSNQSELNESEVAWQFQAFGKIRWSITTLSPQPIRRKLSILLRSLNHPCTTPPPPLSVNILCYWSYVALHYTVDISGKHHPVEEDHVQWIHVPRLGSSCGMAAGFIVFSGHTHFCSLYNFPSKRIL